MSHARSKAEAAEAVAQKALEESRLARITAKELSPSFHIYENGQTNYFVQHRQTAELEEPLRELVALGSALRVRLEGVLGRVSTVLNRKRIARRPHKCYIW